MISDIQENGYDAVYFTLEFESRGFIDWKNSETLKYFFKLVGCTKKLSYLKNFISKNAL